MARRGARGGRRRCAPGRGPQSAPCAARPGSRSASRWARLWLALPGRDLAERDALIELVRVEPNVKAVELIGDESEAVDRGVKVLLPKVGRRLGSRVPDGDGGCARGSVRDPRGRLHHGRRGDAGTGRGRDPGLAAAGNRGRPRRRPGRGDRHDLTPARCAPRAMPRAPARGAGPAQGGRAGPRRRIVLWVEGLGRDGGGAVPGVGRARRPSPTSAAPRRPSGRLAAGRVREPRAGEARIALRRAITGQHTGAANALTGRTDRGRARAGPRRRPRPAGGSLFAVLAVGVVVADQLTKAWVVANVTFGTTAAGPRRLRPDLARAQHGRDLRVVRQTRRSCSRR